MSTPSALAALGDETATLGLQVGVVDLVEPNPQWGNLFEDVAVHVEALLDGLDAQVAHIGSTSVPGLAAKPVLDIAIALAQPINNDDIIARLEAGGFDFQVDLGMYGGLFFTVTSEQGLVVSHVHVVADDDIQWRWYLAFRDGLRAEPQLRLEYTDLKRQAAAAHASDRDSYTKAKFDWVLATVSRLDGLAIEPD